MASNEYMRLYMDKRYKKNRAAMVKQLGGKCAKCGTRKALDIDHIDRAKKTMSTDRMAFVGEARRQAELKNCQLLCRDCHSLKSTLEIGKKPARGTHGTVSSYRYCRCAACKAGKAEANRASARKRNPPRPEAKHGEARMYQRGCRCDACRAANTLRNREWRESK